MSVFSWAEHAHVHANDRMKDPYISAAVTWGILHTSWGFLDGRAKSARPPTPVVVAEWEQRGSKCFNFHSVGG